MPETCAVAYIYVNNISKVHKFANDTYTFSGRRMQWHGNNCNSTWKEVYFFSVFFNSCARKVFVGDEPSQNACVFASQQTCKYSQEERVSEEETKIRRRTGTACRLMICQHTLPHVNTRHFSSLHATAPSHVTTRHYMLLNLNRHTMTSNCICMLTVSLYRNCEEHGSQKIMTTCCCKGTC